MLTALDQLRPKRGTNKTRFETAKNGSEIAKTRKKRGKITKNSKKTRKMSKMRYEARKIRKKTKTPPSGAKIIF